MGIKRIFQDIYIKAALMQIPETITERGKTLLCKYWEHTLTPDEKEELDECCKQDPDMELLRQRLDNKEYVNDYLTARAQARANLKKNRSAAWAKIQARSVLKNKESKLFRWPQLRMAAVVLLVIAGFAWFFSVHYSKEEKQPVFSNKSKVVPGSNRATLTLADRSKFILNDIPNGNIWNKHGIKIIKFDSSINYMADLSPVQRPGSVNDLNYNILETPRGGQFSIILPDGSHIWLNAASKLSFPTSFSSDQRRVELSGEAYFEIAQNSQHPFFVKLDNNEFVEVLGTSFNISAYPDDPDIRTTLLTGKVRVNSGNKTDILYPNEQLIAGKDGSWNLLNDIRAGDAIAWKKDSIYFEGDLPKVMRQITRWYNVEIDMQKFIHAGEFECVLPRGPLPLLLENLSRNRTVFHFAPRGNKILITR